MNNLKKYLSEFNEKFVDLKVIDAQWYQVNCGVTAFCSSANTKDAAGKWSEEYIRARFVWAIIKSGLYDKENICVEFNIPKGNKAKAINPDIVVFKNNNWRTVYVPLVESFHQVSKHNCF